MLLDELVARLTQLPEKSRTEAIELAVKSTAAMAWVPNPKPQTQAFVCEADELFYGGEAGGGKNDLGNWSRPDRTQAVPALAAHQQRCSEDQTSHRGNPGPRPRLQWPAPEMAVR